MYEIELTGKELIVIAASLGAPVFQGVPNPFLGLNKSDIYSEMPKIQSDLEKKQYISIGFEKSFSIKKEVQEIVALCIFCKKYITIDAVQNGSIMPKKVFYLGDEKSVLLKEVDTQYVLQILSSEELTESLFREELKGFVTSECRDENIISRTALKEITDLDEATIKEKWMSIGISLDMADSLYRGFLKELDYCSLIAVDLIEKKSKCFICFFSEKGGLQLMPFYENLEDEWKICWINEERARTVLKEML